MAWQLLEWFQAHTGKPVWMVCRNGHLWEAVVPWSWDFDEIPSIFQRARDVSTPRSRVQGVTRCSLCQTMKQAGFKKLRGITKVHPDYKGVITGARKLPGGTVEHHHPEQIAKAFSEDAVKDWRACMAFVSLVTRRRNGQ